MANEPTSGATSGPTSGPRSTALAGGPLGVARAHLTRRPRQDVVYVALVLGWAVLVGAFLAASGVGVSRPLSLAVIAVLYMPAPAVIALLLERRLVRSRLALPWRCPPRQVARYVLLPPLAIASVLALYLAVTLSVGNLGGVAAVGDVVTTTDGLRDALSERLGQPLAPSAAVPHPALLVGFALLGAAVAGWTINGVFALGEEYGWRGFLWERWSARGPVRANLEIGLVWGLWHAPLVVQGYNYPGRALGGVVVMVVFATAMSFVLSAVRDLTGSVLPVAAAHGAFNAVAAVLLLLTAGGDPLLSGPVGLTGCLCVLLVGLVLQLWVHWRHSTEPVPARP